MMTTSSVTIMTMMTVMISLQLEQVWWWLQHFLYDDDDIDDHQSEVGTGVAGGPSVNKFHEVSLPTSHPYNCRHYHRHQHHHCHPGHRQHHHHHHHRDPHRPHLHVLPLSFNRGQDCRVHLEHCLDVKKVPLRLVGVPNPQASEAGNPFTLRQETLTNSAKPRKAHTTHRSGQKWQRRK